MSFVKNEAVKIVKKGDDLDLLIIKLMIEASFVGISLNEYVNLRNKLNKEKP